MFSNLRRDGSEVIMGIGKLTLVLIKLLAAFQNLSQAELRGGKGEVNCFSDFCALCWYVHTHDHFHISAFGPVNTKAQQRRSSMSHWQG